MKPLCHLLKTQNRASKHKATIFRTLKHIESDFGDFHSKRIEIKRMSHDSGMSSGSSGVRRVFCDGVPQKCRLCDSNVKVLISKSEANPNRKYLRCEYAAAHKLVGDNHLFKWVNVAVDEEVIKRAPLFDILEKDVVRMGPSLEILEKEVAEMKEVQKMVIEQMEEQRKTVKIGFGVVFVGCLLMVAMSKLF